MKGTCFARRMGPLSGAYFHVALVLTFISGCHEFFIADADREVQGLIDKRQRAALGETHDADISGDKGALGDGGQMYRYVPNPIDSGVPEEFRKTTADNPLDPDSTYEDAGTGDAGGLEGSAAANGEPLKLDLAGCLQYALKHSREFQTAKEDLYLSALELTLERHLWTPQFVAEVSTEYANYGQIRDFDHAMSAVAQASATQRLPWGGEVSARVVDTLMRDLGAHTTSGESGQMILEGNLPLLRGAGRVAYESRYQAERNLIYAVRDFEEFRRSFLVSIASDYFDLLVTRSAIENALASETAIGEDLKRTEALFTDGERVLEVEVGRAKVSKLRAQNAVINARESYNSSLDLFKIRLGISPEVPVEIMTSELDVLEPDVTEAVALETAIKYRLDLLNTLDAIDDARRQVLIAKNNLLPQFDLDGSVAMDTDPNHLSGAEYNTERTTWRGMATLEIPLDRKQERNDYRSSIIDLRRAERQYEDTSDRVRADVRRAIRRLEQARFEIQIQRENIKVNEKQREQAAWNLDLGKVSSNRDKLDAEEALRQARNDYAQAISDYRRTILEFLRDTGTLRVGDDGQWIQLTDAPVSTDPAATGESSGG